MKDIFDLLGRMFLSVIFFFDAYETMTYITITKTKMTEYGIVWRQDLLLYLTIFLLILGGLMLLFGYRSKLGAFMLLLYLLPITFIIHSFWNDPDNIRRFQSILFMKNIAICGGLLSVIAHGSGKYSIKRLLASKKVPIGWKFFD
ncbi:MAG: DoxX family membrane protein [Saprospiraceae bacterium]|nr:DoxX family membrane protein [Saprospiraceae bacterium]